MEDDALYKWQPNKSGHNHTLSDKIEFKPKVVTKDRDGHNMIKGTFHQKDTTVINTYAPNRGALKWIKQLVTELRGKLTATQ